MRRPIFVVLALVVLLGAFVSCKAEADRPEVGTWTYHESSDGYVCDMTVTLKQDGSASATLKTIEVEEGVTTTTDAEMSGTYKATADSKGTITYTSGSATITSKGVTVISPMTETQTSTYELSSGYLIVDGDIYTKK